MIMMIIITKIEIIIMIIIIMKWARYPQSVLIHPYNIHIKKNHGFLHEFYADIN